MIIEKFITEVCEQVKYSPYDFRQKILREFLPETEEEILSLTGFLTKQHNITVGTDEIVKFPYDFAHAKTIMVEGEYLFRGDVVDVVDLEGAYGFEFTEEFSESTVALNLRPCDIIHCNIKTRRYSDYKDILYKIQDIAGAVDFSEIYDNENRFIKLLNTTTGYAVRLYYLNNDQTIARVETGDIFEILTTYGVFEVELVASSANFYSIYIAKNGFGYSDSALTTLTGRGRKIHNCISGVFNDISSGDEFKMEYYAGRQSYINELQNDIILDRLHKCIFDGVCTKAYDSMNKDKESGRFENRYAGSLALAQKEVGRIRENGKSRILRTARTPFRLV
jgi:hypothetical protein